MPRARVTPARLAALLSAVILTAPAAAHHSLTAVYDSTRQITVSGQVREFHFVNPHPWIGVNVPDEQGQVRPWRLELDNRFELVDVGMTDATLKPGDRITATGSAGRDGARSLYVRQMDRPDGLHYEQVGPSPRLRLPR